MLGLRPGRFPAVDVATAVLHRRIAAEGIGLLAFGPTPWVQCKSGTGLLHEVAAVFHCLPPTFPMTACPFT